MARRRRPGDGRGAHPEPVARHPRLLQPAAGARGNGGDVRGVAGAGHPRRRQLHPVAAERALGSDRRTAVLAVGPDAARAAGARGADLRARLRPRGGVPELPRPPRRVRLRLVAGGRRVHRHRSQPRPRAAVRGAGVRHDRPRVRGPHRAHHVERRAGADERVDQGGGGRGTRRLLRPGSRRARPRGRRSRRLRRRTRRPGTRQLPGRDHRPRADRRGAGRRHGARRRGARRPTCSRPRRNCCATTSTAAASCCSCWTRRTPTTTRRSPT